MKKKFIFPFQKRVRNLQKFLKKENQNEALPISKRKAALLGFSMVMAIFGVTLAAKSLPALAEDLQNPDSVTPKPDPKPDAIPPAGNNEIKKALIDTASSVGASAITLSSFALGTALGLIVVFGIYQYRKK